MTFLGPFQLRLFNASVMQSQHRLDTETGPLYLSHHLCFFLFVVGIVDRFCTSSPLCSLETTAVHFLRHFQWNTSGCNICGTTNFCAHTLWYYIQTALIWIDMLLPSLLPEAVLFSGHMAHLQVTWLTKTQLLAFFSVFQNSLFRLASLFHFEPFCIRAQKEEP